MQSPSKELKRFRIDVHDAMELAQLTYPVCWFELRMQRYLVSIVIAFVFLGLQFSYVQLYLDWHLSIVGIALVILGEAIDICSTIAVLHLRSKFDQRKLEFPVFEENPHLSAQPTIRDLFWGLPTFIAFLMLPLAAFVPSFGIQIFVNKVAIVLNNHRVKVRLQWVLKAVNGKATLRVKDLIPEYPKEEYVNLEVGGEGGGGLTLNTASLV